MIHKVNYSLQIHKARSIFHLLNVPKSWLEIFLKVGSYLVTSDYNCMCYFSGYAHQQSAGRHMTEYLDVQSNAALRTVPACGAVKLLE